MAESEYVARGRLLVLQRDPNEGGEPERMNRKKVGAPHRYADPVFLAPAAMRRLTGASHGAPEGLARQAPGDDGTPRHALTCGRINVTRRASAWGRSWRRATSAPGDERAVRMAADSPGPQRNDRGE